MMTLYSRGIALSEMVADCDEVSNVSVRDARAGRKMQKGARHGGIGHSIVEVHCDLENMRRVCCEDKMAEQSGITVRINEAVVQLHTDYAPLNDYVETLLSRIRADGEAPNVTSELQWVSKTPLGRKPAPLGSALPEVAYGVHGKDGRVGINYVPGFPGLSAEIEGTGPVSMSARLINRWPADWLRSAVGRYAPGYFPTRLMYHAVYVPAAWYLGNAHRRFWVHSAAVVRGNRALLVGGLAGIGKSTLCLHLMQEDGFTLLSDDLVFYDDARVYTCYEPVRVLADEASDGPEMTGGAEREMGDKRAGELEELVIGNARAGMLVLPRFGSVTQLRELDHATAAHRLYTASRLAAQVTEFDYYGTVLSSYHRDDDWFPLQLGNLRRLLEGVPCFELEMHRADGPGKTYELVREVVDDVLG
jgi:hypothetical protein